MGAVDERVKAAGRFLVSVGGEASPGELGAALGGLNGARQAEVTGELRRRGLVDGPQKRLRLTAEGWAEFGVADVAGAGAAVDRVLSGCLPGWAAPHRAYVRLALSAVVAKAHAFDVRPDDHLSFWSCGPQGTGKTFAGVLVAGLLGLDWRRLVVQLDEQTAGSMRGRRERSAEGWRLAASDVEGLPLALVDELDKAPAPARAPVWRFVRGQGVVWIEGEAHELRPVPMLSANPLPGAPAGDPWAGLLPEGARRRGVLLSSGYVGASRVEDLAAAIDRGMRAWAPADRLALGRLRLPALELGEEARELLRSVGSALAEGWRPVPLRGLEFAALGRMALVPDLGERRAAAATLADYLTATDTNAGAVVATGWPAQLAAWADAEGAVELGELLAGVEDARASAAAAARVVRVARVRESDELVRARAGMVARLEEAAAVVDGRASRAWTADERVRAKACRALLGKLREEAAATRARSSLEDVEARAAGPIADAAGLRCEVEERRAGEEAARVASARALEASRTARRDEEAARRAARAAEAHRAAQAREEAREAARVQVDEVTAYVRRLEAAWQGHGDRTGELLALGLIRYVPDPAPQGGGFLARLGEALSERPGQWWTAQGRRLGPGSARSCPALARDDVLRAVLGPELAQWGPREDELRRVAGVRRRSRVVRIAA